MTLALRLGLIVLAMSAVLAAMVVRTATQRAQGAEILLSMEPVDPRDMLLGYYVTIETPVHQIDTGEVEGPLAGWRQGGVAFVSLDQGEDGSWRPSGVFHERPDEGVFLQGRVAWAYTRSDQRDAEPGPGDTDGLRPREDPIPGTERQELRIAYNLERYFTDADTARELEDMRREDRLRLIVSVGPDGQALIKGLEIDGEARYETVF